MIQSRRDVLHGPLSRALEVEIVGGALARDDRLPTETEPAERPAAGRGVARELAERGPAAVEYGRGAAAFSAAGWDRFTAPVIAAVPATDRDAQPLRHDLGCRRLLAIGAAAVAGERATRAQPLALPKALAPVAAWTAPGTRAVGGQRG